MAQNSAVPTVVAALIIGACIVAAGLMIRSSLDRNTEELGDLAAAVSELEISAAPAAARPSARARPDPERRYSIDTRNAPQRGADDAKVVIVEFSDFQCPFCARVSPTLKRIEKEFGEDVRIVFKHLPLQMHAKAPAAHAAAEAAHLQGKFWEMHDRIFADQKSMSPEKYQEYAAEIGLDIERFTKDVASAGVQSRIDGDVAEAARLGVSGTPGFFINGRFLSGAQPFESFKAMIDSELGRT